MNEEFITTNGRVIFERKVLFIKTAKMRFSDSGLGQWLWALLPVGVITASFFKEDEVRKWASILIATVIFSKNFVLLKHLIVKKSFASRIPLKRVVFFQLEPDATGLETKVHLTLSSGRVRTISFRTLEKQYEPFTELLLNHCALAKVA